MVQPADIPKEDQHDEHQSQGCRRHDKHVDGSFAEYLVAQEAAPAWRLEVRLRSIYLATVA